MSGCIRVLAAMFAASLAAAGCGMSGDTLDGARGECAQGGALTDCPDAERTAVAACWRLVDCGAIAVKSDNENRFTWARCVDAIERATDDRQRLVTGCVAASSCAELRVAGSPRTPDPDEIRCFRLGGL